MLKIGEKRSSVWDTFYNIPKEENAERDRKRVKLIQEIGLERIGDNIQLILPKEVWFLVRDYYELLLRREYGTIKPCREKQYCGRQFCDDHNKHNIFCRDDYKIWYYHFYKHYKSSDYTDFTMEPRCIHEKKWPTKTVMKHINYGRVYFTLKQL